MGYYRLIIYQNPRRWFVNIFIHLFKNFIFRVPRQSDPSHSKDVTF